MTARRPQLSRHRRPTLARRYPKRCASNNDSAAARKTRTFVWRIMSARFAGDLAHASGPWFGLGGVIARSAELGTHREHGGRSPRSHGPCRSTLAWWVQKIPRASRSRVRSVRSPSPRCDTVGGRRVGLLHSRDVRRPIAAIIRTLYKIPVSIAGPSLPTIRSSGPEPQGAVRRTATATDIGTPALEPKSCDPAHAHRVTQGRAASLPWPRYRISQDSGLGASRRAEDSGRGGSAPGHGG